MYVSVGSRFLSFLSAGFVVFSFSASHIFREICPQFVFYIIVNGTVCNVSSLWLEYTETLTLHTAFSLDARIGSNTL